MSNQPQPDPYAATQPQFPNQDLFEVRPSGKTIRRGRGWIFICVLALAVGVVIAMDWVSKSKPVRASPQVTAYGIGNIPLKDSPPTEKGEEVGKEEKKEEKKKPAPKVAPRRKQVLGDADKFEDPSRQYAEKEVASWNSRQRSRGSKETIANQRQSVLGKTETLGGRPEQ